MVPKAIERLLGLGGRPAVDRWFRFAPEVQARYDEDQGAARVRDLRSAIAIGLCFVHVYNISSFLLTPDIALLLLAARILVFTPVTLLLYWLIARSSPRHVELLVLGGMVNAMLLSLSGFWLTEDPRGLYTFGEMFLSVVFANMLLALRFQHAVVFTLATLLLATLAIVTKAGLEPMVQVAFAVQMATACAFALAANYRLERRRCDDYLAALSATLEAEEAETARHTFQVLSGTDALTGLPNRRQLSETIERWWAAPGELALMMIDIDHFKPYNDRLGHPVGDECQRRVADVLAAAVRDTDAFCARFGGEEFTVLARVWDEADVEARAQTLVEAVRAAFIPHPARPDDVTIVTVSIGAAMRRDVGAASPGALFALADKALYEAKQRGRNGYALSEPSDLLRRAG